jgi:hypothetical protein
VWDNFGLPHILLLANIAAVLDPSVDRRWLSPPLTAANEMAELWREVGLQHVEQTSLLIRMEYSCFDDYSPFTRGEGPLGQLVASLSDNNRPALTEHMRSAYLSSRPDGPRSIPCAAWACRGAVPAYFRPVRRQIRDFWYPDAKLAGGAPETNGRRVAVTSRG